MLLLEILFRSRMEKLSKLHFLVNQLDIRLRFPGEYVTHRLKSTTRLSLHAVTSTKSI